MIISLKKKVEIWARHAKEKVQAFSPNVRSQNEAQTWTSTLPSTASRASGMRVVRFWSGTRFHQSVSILSRYTPNFSLGIFVSHDKQPTVETVAGVLDSRDGDPSAHAWIDRQPYSWILEYKVTPWPTARITCTRCLKKGDWSYHKIRE